MDQNTTHTQTRWTDEVSDDTIRETITGKNKTEYGIDPVKASTDLEDFPDGRMRAWLIIGGVMCSAFATIGFVNAWGVITTSLHLSKAFINQLFSAWIGSVQYALILMPGIIVGHLFHIGYFRIPFILASILVVVSTFLIAECIQYWHFLLCQGFAIGVPACWTIFSCVVGIIGHWFRRRRGFAMGLTTSSGSIGSTVFPIVARRLIKDIGFPWTMQVIAFILIFTMGIALLAMRRHLPPANASGAILNLKAFTNASYSLWCLATFTAYMGIYTGTIAILLFNTELTAFRAVLTYINVSATTYGVSPDTAFYRVSIVNTASGIGRIIAGIWADRFDALNVVGPMTIIAGAVTYAWPFARTLASMIVVAVIYGHFVFHGAYTSLFFIPVFELGEIGDVGQRTGMTISIAAPGAVAGPPISGAIHTATRSFEAIEYYAGMRTRFSLRGLLIVIFNRQCCVVRDDTTDIHRPLSSYSKL
ncbi:major facilitator superfamily domain-containing protein [Armillaria fumosa]|nr:major facilitator superfamily domain-containing protein [Armillaria fumosa]